MVKSKNINLTNCSWVYSAIDSTWNWILSKLKANLYRRVASDLVNMLWLWNKFDFCDKSIEEEKMLTTLE